LGVESYDFTDLLIVVLRKGKQNNLGTLDQPYRSRTTGNDLFENLKLSFRNLYFCCLPWHDGPQKKGGTGEFAKITAKCDFQSRPIRKSSTSGDTLLAKERLESLDGVPLLPITPEVPQNAQRIMALGVLPQKAQVDALHISLVAHHRIQYLLTWNCKHIANARILPRIHDILTEMEIPIPIICTPEEMLGDESDES